MSNISDSVGRLNCSFAGALTADREQQVTLRDIKESRVAFRARDAMRGAAMPSGPVLGGRCYFLWKYNTFAGKRNRPPGQARGDNRATSPLTICPESRHQLTEREAQNPAPTPTPTSATSLPDLLRWGPRGKNEAGISPWSLRGSGSGSPCPIAAGLKQGLQVMESSLSSVRGREKPRWTHREQCSPGKQSHFRVAGQPALRPHVQGPRGRSDMEKATLDNWQQKNINIVKAAIRQRVERNTNRSPRVKLASLETGIQISPRGKRHGFSVNILRVTVQ